MAGSHPQQQQQQQNGIMVTTTTTTTVAAVSTKTTPHIKMSAVFKSNSINSNQQQQQISSINSKLSESHQSNDSNLPQQISSIEQYSTESHQSNLIDSNQQGITSIEQNVTESHQSNDSNDPQVTSNQQNVTESHQSNSYDSNQQGIMSIVTTTASIGEHWEVQYARFFNTPSISGTRHPSLVYPLKKNKGTWISSFTSLASLRLLTTTNDYSDTIILQVTLDDKITEEHYISKLHFTWPKVSCLSGYPPRGSKVVFMSYKDQVGQIQKFAVRFLSADETERFINFLKEIFGHERINVSTSGISKSKTSSQSEIIPFIQPEIRPALEWNPIASSEVNSQDVYRPIQDWSPIASSAETYIQQINSDEKYVADPAETYIQQINSHEKYVADPAETYIQQNSNEKYVADPAETYIQPINSDENYVADQYSNPLESALTHDVQGKLSAFPPSFTSLLMSCYSVDEQATQPILPEEVALKKEIMKYLEDSSFQEMLSKVQKVVNEIGDELLL